LIDKNRIKGKYCIPLNEETILKLPYYAFSADCIHLISQRKKKAETAEIPTETKTVFTVNLSHSISQLKNKEISEIRYDCGNNDSIRIYLDEEGNLEGEYSCKAKASLLSFVKKLSVF
jgi:hypothetical protein